MPKKNIATVKNVIVTRILKIDTPNYIAITDIAQPT
jgi:hypothetical protein